jgi:release factor glutamine methyltransferase
MTTLEKLQKEYLSPSSETRLAPEDFFVLLAETTGKDKAFLLAHPEYVLDAETEAKTREYFKRRLKREPVTYIVGHKEFYGRDFLVTPDTLVPRPETELLVELTLNKISNFQFPISNNIAIIDVGTGSGNIIITLAKEIGNPIYEIQNTRYEIHATDISAGALTTAQENAARHGVSDAISFHEGSLLEPIDKDVFEAADEIIIAANLPYLSHEIYQSSHDDVKLFEPETALVSEAAGLDHYYRLLEETRSIPKPMTLFLEISPEQTPAITKYLAERFPQAETSIHQDLSARDRVVEIRLA